MRRVSQPLVKDAFQVSVTNGPLQAVEAGINSARRYLVTLPKNEQTARVAACLETCWLQCMLLFTAGREEGLGNATEAASRTVSINTGGAAGVMEEAMQVLRDIAREHAGNDTAVAAMIGLLTEPGNMITSLYDEGRREGTAIKEGVTVKLPVNKDKPI